MPHLIKYVQNVLIFLILPVILIVLYFSGQAHCILRFYSCDPGEKDGWSLHLCAGLVNPAVVTEPFSNNGSRSFTHRARYDLIISVIHCMLSPGLTCSWTGIWGSAFPHSSYDNTDGGGKMKMVPWHQHAQPKGKLNWIVSMITYLENKPRGVTEIEEYLSFLLLKKAKKCFLLK